MSSSAPASVTAAVLVPSKADTTGLTPVQGYDFNKGVDFEALLNNYRTMGFQSTSLGDSIDEINRMIKWRLSDEPVPEDESDYYKDPVLRKNHRCTIYLGYTSNLISSGIREVIRYLAQHAMIDCIVTSAGGVEEDFIKCLAPTFLGQFHLSGRELRLKGLNRIGNLLQPNDNYVKFEEWIMPILDQMTKEQHEQGVIWSPSKIIYRLGREINDENSVYYWCWKNQIPVFCPALTDGSIGDMIYMHSYKYENPLVVDIAQDLRKLNSMSAFAKKTGVIILGGGVIKHHILNANLMRNGADFAVFVNTGQEFDGSDSGARPDEAVSWGKIRLDAHPVKVYADATLVFPLLVAMTFAKTHEPRDLVKHRKNILYEKI